MRKGLRFCALGNIAFKINLAYGEVAYHQREMVRSSDSGENANGVVRATRCVRCVPAERAARLQPLRAWK